MAKAKRFDMHRLTWAAFCGVLCALLPCAALALSSGSPICKATASAMDTGHGSSIGVTPTWSITAPSQYTPGVALTINLQHSTNVGYRGILLWVTNAADTAIGTFSSIPSGTRTLTCDAGQSITHNAATSKSTPAALIWTPPATATGVLTVRAIIEQDCGVSNCMNRWTLLSTPIAQTPAPVVLSGIGAQATTKGRARDVALMVNGGNTPLALSAVSSSDPAVIPLSSLSFTPTSGGAGARTLHIAAPPLSGTSTVTVRLADALNNISEQSFNVQVNPVPSIATIATQNIETESMIAIPVVLNDGTPPHTVLATSSEPTIATAAVNGSGATRQLEIVTSDQPGSAQIRLDLTDDAGATAERTFTLNNIEPALFDASVSIVADRVLAFAGEPVVYTIVVQNAGPSAVTGLRVLDLLPAWLISQGWTCAPGAGAACASSGAGNIDQLINLEAGSQVTYSLGTLAGVSPGGGGLVNQASVQEPPFTDDTVQSNNLMSVLVEQGFLRDGFE
jgi:uncharacterized repeat protein (TIGR01451 family)